MCNVVDVSDLDVEAAPGATVTLPNPNSNMLLNVSIKVTDPDSPWYGATYEFVVTVPEQFPIQAPRAECKTMVRPLLWPLPPVTTPSIEIMN